MNQRARRGLALAFAAVVLPAGLSGCRLFPGGLLTGGSFERYVALGDSITAGYQSGGLYADGQASSYPVLLSQRAGKPIRAPEGRGPGCPPPIGAGPPSAESCTRADPAAPTGDFAVPGARVEDLLGASAPNVPEGLKPLYTLILGNQTQVGAALAAKPRYISVWIGANNVLGATLAGDPGAATPPAAFEAAYGRLLDALAASKAKLILLTVPRVTTVPVLVPGPRLYALGLADASCKSSSARLNVGLLAGPGAPKQLSCAAAAALTQDEARAANDFVAAYNSSIRKLAAAKGAKVYDVNMLLGSLKPADFAPNTTAPFGPDFSADGVHPSNAMHARLARALASFVNANFGTRINDQ